MPEESVALEIANPQAALRYLGEMQSRTMDPIHEPIQNLLDEGALRIDVELDARNHQIRIRGDARPITSVTEARRILQSICASKKRGKLGEKGVGMLSFLTVGTSMTTISQKGGRVVWFKITRDRLSGRVGSEKGNRLPYAGTEVRIYGVTARNLRYRFSEDRVIKDVKRRWGTFLTRGLRVYVNGKDVASFTPPLTGEQFRRCIPIEKLGKGETIEVNLLVLKDPSDVASVSVTHRGQANFLVSDVPLFDGHNAFTQGMLDGTVTGDIAPLNASRTGFQDSKAFDIWVENMLDLEEELGKLIEDRIRTAAEARDAAMLEDWMRHLRTVFRHSELASAKGVAGEGEEEGWDERDTAGSPGTGTAEGSDGEDEEEPTPSRRRGKGGPGRLPTVPYAGFTKAPPNVRVVRERNAFRINVNHPDFILAAKSQRGRRSYIRELCMHEAYIYSLEGRQRDWFTDRSDEFLSYWTRAFVSSSRSRT